MLSKYLPGTSPSKSPVTDLPPANDLGDPLSDEDDPVSYNRSDPLSPYPSIVRTWTADTDNMVIKSEPMDVLEGLLSESHPLLPLQLVEHSYSYTEHIGVCSSDQFKNLNTVEDESSARTSGCKWPDEDQSSRYSVDSSDCPGINVVVRMRKKSAPLTTSRLIIPVVRVARSAVMKTNVMQNANGEMNVVHSNIGGPVVDPLSECPFLFVAYLSPLNLASSHRESTLSMLYDILLLRLLIIYNIYIYCQDNVNVHYLAYYL